MSALKESLLPLTDDNRRQTKVQGFASKRWWYLIPLIFITYSLAYLDRANYGFASAAGIEQDLGITKSTSSLIGALFFLGYFFFQVPGAIYAQKYSVRKLVFWSLILWGFCAMATGLVTNIPMLMVIRVSLGIVEAAVMPAMLIFISNWFTRKERSRANTFLVLGNPVTVLWMSVVSGYLIHAWGWREMFVIEGAPAVLWAFVWWRLARDKPEQVDWLSRQEKDQLAATLAEEQKGMQVVRNYRQVFTSPIVIQLCCVHALWSIGGLWLHHVAADHHQAGGCGGHRHGWLVECGALRRSGRHHAGGVLGLGQIPATQAFRLAAAGPGGAGVLLLLPAGLQSFLVVVRLVDPRRCCTVRPVRSVLRADPGDPAGQRVRWRYRPDQCLRRAGGLYRLMDCWLPDRPDRQPWRGLHFHDGRGAVVGPVDGLGEGQTVVV